MSSKTAAVSVRNLSKSYTIAHNAAKHTTAAEALVHRLKNPLSRPETETFWALKDVSFDIEPGDVVGIIGRNGAGKSTLLKVLSRITEPTGGEAVLRGRVGSLLEVGTGFHPELTGRENVYLNGAILGMTRREIDRQFDAIVDFSGTEKFLDTPVKRYSSGMYVRLAFAVAAHLEPEILIVDEVLAVGDAEFQKKCMGKMQDVAHHGRTVLFVSHNMAAVQQLCQYALLMRQGMLVMQGETESVVSGYLSDATTSSNGVYDVRDHIARSPESIPTITAVTLHSADGTCTSQFYPNEPCIVDIDIEPNGTIREPRIAIAIEDSYGRRIGTTGSFLQESNVPDVASDTTIRCSIPSLPLGPGRYLISVSVADRFSGMLDSIDGAGWFDVDWNNNYGNGEPYHPVYGPVLLKAAWFVSSR